MCKRLKTVAVRFGDYGIEVCDLDGDQIIGIVLRQRANTSSPGCNGSGSWTITALPDFDALVGVDMSSVEILYICELF